jgi:hypothetical protein
MGLDAMERVLKKVKYEGMRHFGHSCMFVLFGYMRAWNLTSRW